MSEYAKEKLGLAARVGHAGGFGGVAENIEQPEYASVVGLMLIDAENGSANSSKSRGSGRKVDSKKAKESFKKASGTLSKFLGKFKV